MEHLTAAERRYARKTGEVPSIHLNLSIQGVGKYFSAIYINCLPDNSVSSCGLCATISYLNCCTTDHRYYITELTRIRNV
jgi:hypothetical protein